MSRFLLSFLIISTFCYSSKVLASTDCYEDDLKSSKSSFIISKALYGDLVKDKKGVMTLCFEADKNVGLAFEYFNPKVLNEVNISMVHCSPMGDYCGTLMVQMASSRDTLTKVHRGKRIIVSNGTEENISASYIKYASWVLPNKDLLDALAVVEKDIKSGKPCSKSSINYACDIMGIAGLRNVNFGFWFHTPKNLKILTKDYIAPKPYAIHQ